MFYYFFHRISRICLENFRKIYFLFHFRLSYERNTVTFVAVGCHQSREDILSFILVVVRGPGDKNSWLQLTLKLPRSLTAGFGLGKFY